MVISFMLQVDGCVEYEDADDYLLYLEDILTTIHRAFFELYEQMQSKVRYLTVKYVSPDII